MPPIVIPACDAPPDHARCQVQVPGDGRLHEAIGAPGRQAGAAGEGETFNQHPCPGPLATGRSSLDADHNESFAQSVFPNQLILI